MSDKEIVNEIETLKKGHLVEKIIKVASPLTESELKRLRSLRLEIDARNRQNLHRFSEGGVKE